MPDRPGKIYCYTSDYKHSYIMTVSTSLSPELVASTTESRASWLLSFLAYVTMVKLVFDDSVMNQS